jgi:hypothetical protein
MISKIELSNGDVISCEDLEFFILCFKHKNKEDVSALLDLSPEEAIISIIHLSRIIEESNEGSIELIHEALSLLMSGGGNNGEEGFTGRDTGVDRGSPENEYEGL